MQDKKKNKNVRFSFDILRGDIINRVALRTKLMPRTARNSRYLPTYMIRCAHVTRKLCGRSAVDNLGSPYIKLQLTAVLFSFGNKRFLSVIIHRKATEGYKLHGMHSENICIPSKNDLFW